MTTATETKSQDNHNPDAKSGFEHSDPQIETLPPLWKRIDPELRTTGGFVFAAVIALAITGALAIANRPAPIKEFGKVGQAFYPDFTDPTLATALEVYAFDPDDVKPLDFQVRRLDNGRWVIPSHHNYPADAEDQLAKTAASIIGIERGALVTRWKADHGHYGVVNPKQDALNVDEVEGVGKRIILRGEYYDVLADYIIGKKVEGSIDEYYVRHPEEEEVYIAKVDINLSTKFADWIETDLFDFDSWDVREVVANNYSFDELRGQITSRDVTVLTRASSSDDWKLDGLNEDIEEVNKDSVRETIDAIGGLKIVGVRPKQQGLTPELKLDREALSGRQDVDRLQTDLLARGFLLQPGESGDPDNLKLLAREGELTTATEDGLIYRMYFGRVFTGSQEELEIGLASSGDVAGDSPETEASETESQLASVAQSGRKTEGDSSESSDEASASTENNGDEAEPDGKKPGRYVFVRVDFDEKYVGQQPVQPTEPEKPAELVEADRAEQGPRPAETSSKAEGQASAAADDQARDSKPEGGQPDKESEDAQDPLAEIRKKYDEAKKNYDDDLKDYERKVEERKEKIADGKKKAEELNRRFTDWYYVIPGESFDKLNFARVDLVKQKEKVADEESKAEDSDSR